MNVNGSVIIQRIRLIVKVSKKQDDIKPGMEKERESGSYCFVIATQENYGNKKAKELAD